MRFGEGIHPAADTLPPAEKPEGQKATEFAHDYLKGLILDLVLAPGTIVTEMNVANATGISRTPIREALLRLHEERLVELLPRRGALISGITPRQIRELYDVRQLMEGRAVEIICADRVPVSERLEQLCDLQERLDREGASAGELIKVDRQFHSLLIAATGNSVLEMINESLGDHHQRTGVMSFSLDRGRCAVAVKQHRELAHALAGFDLAASRSILEQHLIRGERELELLLHP
jgi:DNA-binding GntR family transcriptional regulator